MKQYENINMGDKERRRDIILLIVAIALGDQLVSC